MTGVVPHDGSKNSKKLKPTAHQLTAHAAGFDARAAVSTRMQLYAGLAGISVDGGLGSRCASAHAYQRSSCRDARGVYVYDLMSNHAMHLLLSGSAGRPDVCIGSHGFPAAKRTLRRNVSRKLGPFIHAQQPVKDTVCTVLPWRTGDENRATVLRSAAAGTSLRAKNHVCE